MSEGMRFDTGMIVTTPNALRTVPPDRLADGLRRHMLGDWGDISENDRKENDLSVREGYRILSAYTFGEGSKFWIITEADRSSTCVLMPEDY